MNFQGFALDISRFKKYSNMVLEFLKEERKKPDEARKLYLHQIDALIAVNSYFSGVTPDKPSLIVAPTGAGKSGIVALLPYVLASSKALIISPSVVISDQLEKDFGLRNAVTSESFVSKVGLIPPGDFLNDFLEKGKRIDYTEVILNMEFFNLVIVNAQKFGSNSNASLAETEHDDVDFREQIQKIKKQFIGFSTLIVDEAHHFPAKTWDLICKEFIGRQIIFLTATPFRGRDRKALWPGQLITYQILRQTLIDRHVIRRLFFQTINCNATDFVAIRQFIVETLLNHDLLEPAVKHKAIVLTNLISEAKDGANAMPGDATYVTAEKRTENNLKGFESSKYSILFVCGRLLEGYDNPDISLCVILRNVKVLGLFTQFVGRCIRTSKGLPYGRVDCVDAIVASVPEFNQEQNYNLYMNYT